MRVGLACPYDLGSPGGVQQLITELGSHLAAAGDEVVLVAAGETALAGPPEGVTLVLAGRPVAVRANESTVPLTLDPGSWRLVRSALRDVDVVNVHEPMVPLVGWAALSVGKPTVATIHADAPLWARRLYRWTPLLGNIFRHSLLTAASPTAAEAIPPSFGRPRIIPNAIEVASYDVPVERNERRVAFLGRDEPRKGLDVLLEAWPLIQSSHPAAELVVMGADRGVPPPGITYLGPVTGDEKRKVLASSTVYVAPNIGGESFGLVIAEGMAAGCAVVASDLEAFTAVMGGAGRTFPAGDARALAGEVSRLLDDPDEARRLGSAARESVRRFDWSERVSDYRSAYAEAL